ncbi:uncharacterized protein [Nicotiana sylvestris]|uniref:uncharacterized protein n=1 Tax=Nicotiana sylvestris TaxID=4096 RepID=UPI00388CD95E
MTIKLVVVKCTLNIINTYTPQVGLEDEVKRRFWEGSYTEVHGGFSFGDRNGRGTSLLDFAKAFELVITNSSFPKREEANLVTFQSTMVKTQIDYLLFRRCDRGLCEDCKVITGETLIRRISSW